MTPSPTTMLPLSLFWTLLGGDALTLILLQGLALTLRGRPGGVSWLLLAAMGTLLALLVVLLAVQVGQFSPMALDGLVLFNVELAGVALSTALHLLLSWLLPRRSHPLPPPPAPTGSRRQEVRRWRQ